MSSIMKSDMLAHLLALRKGRMTRREPIKFIDTAARGHGDDSDRGTFPRGTEHERASTARFHRQGESGQSVPPGLRAKDGGARPDRADGRPAAELLWCSTGTDQIRLQADQARGRRLP